MKVPPVYTPVKEPLEKKVEAYFKRKVANAGGITFKFNSPMQRSVPDQIVILIGRVLFCEIKRVSGKLSDGQSRVLKKLDDNSAECCTIYGHSGVDDFIEQLVAQTPIANKEFK